MGASSIHQVLNQEQALDLRERMQQSGEVTHLDMGGYDLVTGKHPDGYTCTLVIGWSSESAVVRHL